MFILENSDYSIYNEYLQIKYKDNTIKVINRDISNSSNTELVLMENDKGWQWVEINYNELWVIVRKLKLKKLKSKICHI